MDYRYISSVGTFFIRRQPESGVELLIDDIPLGTYDSVESAWRDVAQRSTGWDEWDRLAQIDIPELEKWEEMPPTRH